MELETLELTVEDIVRLHRGYITDLFVAGRKSEVEIVQLLYERRLLVTLPHIQNCIREWGLLSMRAPSLQPEPELETPELEVEGRSVITPIDTEPQPDTHAVSDGSVTVHPDNISQPNSGSRLSVSSNPSVIPDSFTYTPSPVNADLEPESANLYKDRPLPPLPTSSGHKRRSSQLSDRPRKDKLKVTWHHGDESHPVEMPLETLPQGGPSPIETYTSDEQGHERVPLDMERTSERLVAPRKAGTWSGKGTGYRTATGIKRRKKYEKGKNDGKSSSESPIRETSSSTST